jgi:hypothetical protein
MTMSTEETNVQPAETQNQPDTTQTAPEVVTPEVDTQQTEAPAESKEDDADKARKAMQRRIDKRTADVYRERAEKEQLQRELADLRARASGQPEQQTQQVDPYALAREIAQMEKVNDKANGIAKDGEKRFPDFKDALVTVAEEAGQLFDSKGKPTAIGDAILDADDPAALLHYLGKNPDLAAELQGLSPAQLGRRIGRMEAQMSSSPQPKPVSKAPDPARPIAATQSAKNPANMSMAEYEAMRRAQGARWAR